MLLESVFHWLFCLKFSFKLVTFSKSYARKQEWLFFSEHSVYHPLTVHMLTQYMFIRGATSRSNECNRTDGCSSYPPPSVFEKLSNRSTRPSTSSDKKLGTCG